MARAPKKAKPRFLRNNPALHIDLALELNGLWAMLSCAAQDGTTSTMQLSLSMLETMHRDLPAAIQEMKRRQEKARAKAIN